MPERCRVSLCFLTERLISWILFTSLLLCLTSFIFHSYAFSLSICLYLYLLCFVSPSPLSTFLSLASFAGKIKPTLKTLTFIFSSFIPSHFFIICLYLSLLCLVSPSPLSPSLSLTLFAGKMKPTLKPRRSHFRSQQRRGPGQRGIGTIKRRGFNFLFAMSVWPEKDIN